VEHPVSIFQGLIAMVVPWVLHLGGYMFAFVRDFQTLLAGIIAIVAALITARPVWRQLDRMSVQTNTMYREFLADRLKALEGRRKWLFEQIAPYRQEVGQRMYEMREFENGLNIHWVFERSQITGLLVSKLEAYRDANRDSAEMAGAVDDMIGQLKVLEDNMDDIHRPHSTEQSGEDWSYTDEEWAEVGRKGEAADAALDGLVADFEVAAKRLREVVDHEIDRLRDRVKATDDALMKKL